MNGRSARERAKFFRVGLNIDNIVLGHLQKKRGMLYKICISIGFKKTEGYSLDIPNFREDLKLDMVLLKQR